MFFQVLLYLIVVSLVVYAAGMYFFAKHFSTVTKVVKQAGDNLRTIDKKMQYQPLGFEKPEKAFAHFNPGLPSFELVFEDKEVVVDRFTNALLVSVNSVTDISGKEGDPMRDFTTYLVTKENESGEILKAIVHVDSYFSQLQSGGSSVKGKDFDVAHWAEDGKVKLSGQIRVIVPTENCDVACRKTLSADIIKALKEAEVKRERNVEPKQNSTRHASIIRTSSTMPPRIVYSEYTYNHMDNSMMDLCYRDVTQYIDGSKYILPMSAMFEEAISTLKNRENVVIFAAPGNGKTTLLENFEARFSAEGDYVVIRMDHETVESMKTQEGRTHFNQILASQAPKTIILTFDEAQSFSTSMSEKELPMFLELMDGTAKRKHKLAILMFVNATEEQLRKVGDGAFMRDGRVSLSFGLEAHTPETAVKLVNKLREDKDRTFDVAKFDVLENRENITIAQIFSCFRDKGFSETRKTRIEQYRKP